VYDHAADALEVIGEPPLRAHRARYVGNRPKVDGVTATSAGVVAVIVGRARRRLAARQARRRLRGP
jgi:hypothetical protein